MLRFILFLLLVYLLWKLIGNVFRTMGSGGSGQVRNGQSSAPKSKQDHRYIADAEFEDLPEGKGEGETPPK